MTARIQIVGDSDVPQAAAQAHPVVGYVRVSMLDTTKQTLSPEAQARIIRDYCKLHSLGEPEVLSERGSAKSIAGRPIMRQLLAMCRAGQIQHVVCQDTTRLFREVREALNTFAELADLGVQVHSAVEGGRLDDSASAQLQRNVKLVFGQYERQVIGERTRRALATKVVKLEPGLNPAMLERAVTGKLLVGSPPLGYKIEKKKWVPFWKEMAVMKFARALYAQGYSMNQVRGILCNSGIRNRLKKPYNKTQVFKLLTSTLYMEPPDAFHFGEASPHVLQGFPRPRVRRDAQAEA